jgi:hypothetical protein
MATMRRDSLIAAGAATVGRESPTFTSERARRNCPQLRCHVTGERNVFGDSATASRHGVTDKRHTWPPSRREDGRTDRAIALAASLCDVDVNVLARRA